MKTLFTFALLLAAGTAQAGTQELPEPTLTVILGLQNLAPRCQPNYTPNRVATIYARQGIVGWSTDGTRLQANIYGNVPHGNCYGGRGISYYRYCGTLTWNVTLDSLGNLNPIDVATFVSGACPITVQGPIYNNFGYGAEVVVTPDPSSPSYSWDVATLITP